jgi:peroxiredoxin Q/BCP
MFRKPLAALVFAAALVLPGAAQQSAVPADEMIGPMVGAQAPAGTVVTAAGEETTLAALAGENGTAIAFVRSLDWCPYCKAQAKGLEAARAPLEEAGWSLVLLSYDSPETLAGFAEKNGLTYTMVSDANSELIRAYGLLNEEMREGSKYWGIPHPAVVFVRTDGTVGAVLREEGYEKRPEVEAITETALLLNEAAGS